MTVQLTFSEHLKELQHRLLWVGLSITTGSIIGYFLRDSILRFLIQPLHQSLYYSSPTGGFDLIFKISLLFGVFIASPLIIYQILKFIQPALPTRITRLFVKFLFGSFFLLLLGSAVAYYLSLPAALHLLQTFNSDHVKSLISTKEYFSFALAYLGGFGLLFQLPIIMLLIHEIAPFKPSQLLAYLRHVVLISFIIAAVLTPTGDPINQSIMALPTILLYLLTIAIIAVKQKPAYAQ